MLLALNSTLKEKDSELGHHQKRQVKGILSFEYLKHVFKINSKVWLAYNEQIDT